MMIYIPDFWAGFCTGGLVFLILLCALTFWAQKRKEAKAKGEKNETG